jgi:hypothetical protein
MPNIELSQKSNHELAIIDDIFAWLFKTYDLDWQLGDLFWSATYGMAYLVDIELINPNKENPYEKNNINIYFNFYKRVEQDKREGRTNDYDKRHKYSLFEYFQYSSSKPIKIEANSEEEFDKDLNDVVNGVTTLEHLLSLKYPETSGNQGSELMIMNKDILLERKKDLVKKQQFLQSRSEAAKVMLENRASELRKVAERMNKFIAKLNRLIYSIELYLGIKEEMHQFGFGNNAPAEEPICFRQRRMYMDVEVGDPLEDLKGLDWEKIDAFDEWLMKDNVYWKKKNYELVIPENKCVVIFRVREKDKDYGTGNPFIEGNLNIDNRLTYILIRNGENIYRIFGDITIGEKLFPDQEELTELIDRIEGRHKPDTAEYKWVHGREQDKEQADDIVERYKLNMILLQGIIERTPCFPENSTTTNIFSPDGYDGKIKFIYDATLNRQLPSGVPTFLEWQKTLNKDIKEGSRVFLISSLFSKHWGSGNDKSRLFKVYYNEHSVPAKPTNGIYQVYSEKNHTTLRNPTPYEQLFIKYNPKDDIAWSWSDSYYDREDKTRKNRLSWAIYESDNFLINYDAISREDLKTLEFYLYTRIGRENYLSYMPTLFNLFKAKEKEIQEEDNFIKLCLTQAGLDAEIDFQSGIDAMEWWKLKNKWKRALTADDSKALRMIVSFLKR